MTNKGNPRSVNALIMLVAAEQACDPMLVCTRDAQNADGGRWSVASFCWIYQRDVCTRFALTHHDPGLFLLGCSFEKEVSETDFAGLADHFNVEELCNTPSDSLAARDTVEVRPSVDRLLREPLSCLG